jgi:Transcriptional regulators
MDDIDARIVAFLVRDARASYAIIGGEVGLSAPAVKRRVDRLRAAGAITGFSARVDPAAMGWTTEAYVELYCGGRTSPEEIGVAVRRYPEVVDACTITGGGRRPGPHQGHRREALRGRHGAHPGRILRGQDQERDRPVAAGRPGRRAGPDALKLRRIPASGQPLTS